MNWLDLVLVAGGAAGALLGMWVGLIRAAFALAGVLLGILLAGQLKDNLAALFANYVSSETLANALGYAATISIVVAGTVIAAAIVRKMVYGLFLGWADRLAGLALGLMAAIVVSAAAVAGIAGLTYRHDLPQQGLAGRLLEKAPRFAEAKEKLRDSLDESVVVSMLLNVTDALPGGIALVPSGVRAVLVKFEE